MKKHQDRVKTVIEPIKKDIEELRKKYPTPERVKKLV